MKCLTLLATAGEKPDWNTRQKSNGHKAIPLPSKEFVERLPMIANLISQLKLEISKVLKPGPDFMLDAGDSDHGVFYIPNAEDSEMIPDQENFVKPQGLKSVLGFGGVLPSGNFFAVILFSNFLLI
jgi:hypothetical protein